MPAVAVVIPAAGRGSRFGGDTPKQYLLLGGRPVLAWTLDAFAGLADEAIIAVDDAWRDAAAAIAAAASLPTRLVAGGPSRQESVHAGLLAARADLVLIHDAVRPCVPRSCIAACIAALATHPAAVVAVPCAATVKRAASDGLVDATVPRDGLWLAQTPQGCRRPAGLDAFARAAAAGWACSDDAQVCERAGLPVALVPGDARNLKITTPDDLSLAAAILGISPPG